MIKSVTKTGNYYDWTIPSMRNESRLLLNISSNYAIVLDSRMRHIQCSTLYPVPTSPKASMTVWLTEQEYHSQMVCKPELYSQLNVTELQHL